MEDRAGDAPDDGTVPIDRRGFVRAWGVAGALAVTGCCVPAAAAEESDEELNEIWTNVLAALPDNWGKWGDDDELGALNYLDDEQAFRGIQTALRGEPSGLEVFALQLSYTGEAVTGGDPTGDPVFPTRQPARRDNVVDHRHYQNGAAEPLRGGMRFSDDAFITRLFLQGSTQYDALAHVWYERPTEDGGREPLLYNGYPAETTAAGTEYDVGIPGLRPPNPLEEPFSTDLREEEITKTWGPSKGDILHAAEAGSVGRGVLLDVGRYKVDEPPYRLDPGECVTLDDLKATAEAQGTALEKRDIVLIRTGSIERARDPDAEKTWLGDPDEPLREPGLCFSQDLVEFVADMEFPVLGADNLAVEKLTTAEIDVEEDINEDVRAKVDFDGRETLEIVNPLHPALITNLGVTLCEILDLSALAESCAEDGIYEFLYAAAPLKIEGGAGAPVNPVVVKATGPGCAEGSDPMEE
ncbi:cyclase family protein [Halegenticoccus soli]|uniref:cyclase family protein n=1 Tax=Halegenticoccus soli TaxID=1985678 RepID=UPI000C6CFF05|nr:cyclase family protein [Halegenticoccus soli]